MVPCGDDGDYHLMSTVGRWHVLDLNWVLDNMTSPCIDAADPITSWTDELAPHEERANMGAYGVTPQASLSALPVPGPDA